MQPIGCVDSLAGVIDRTVRRSVDIDADVAEAWHLLTDPDGIARWLGRLDGPLPAPGGVAALVEPDGSTRRLVVESIDDGRSVVFTWWADGDESTASTVTISVTETAAGSRVDVVETARSGGAQCRVADAGALWSDRLVGFELAAITRSLVLA